MPCASVGRLLDRDVHRPALSELLQTTCSDRSAAGGRVFVVDSPVLPEELEVLPSVLAQTGLDCSRAARDAWRLGPPARPAGIPRRCARLRRDHAQRGWRRARRRAARAARSSTRALRQRRPLQLGQVQGLPCRADSRSASSELELHADRRAHRDGMAIWAPWARVLSAATTSRRSRSRWIRGRLRVAYLRDARAAAPLRRARRAGRAGARAAPTAVPRPASALEPARAPSRLLLGSAGASRAVRTYLRRSARARAGWIGSPSAIASSADRAGLVRGDLVLHLHRLDDADSWPSLTAWPCSTSTFHTLPCSGEAARRRRRRRRRSARAARCGAARAGARWRRAAGAAPPAGGGPMTLTSKRLPETSTV